MTAGEFGSERLVQKVVDTILRQTAMQEEAEGGEQKMSDTSPSLRGEPSGSDSLKEEMTTPSKIILTGHKVSSAAVRYYVHCT